MNETMQQLSQAETNRLIRADLKACFPGTRFTVRAANGVGITQTVIGWEIGYRPNSADFDGYYSPTTCLLADDPTQADIDALAARYSSWEWSSEDGVKDFAPERLVSTEDGVKDFAPERLVSTEAGKLPALIRYGAGNVAAYPSYKNLDL